MISKELITIGSGVLSAVGTMAYTAYSGNTKNLLTTIALASFFSGSLGSAAAKYFDKDDKKLEQKDYLQILLASLAGAVGSGALIALIETVARAVVGDAKGLCSCHGPSATSPQKNLLTSLILTPSQFAFERNGVLIPYQGPPSPSSSLYLVRNSQ